RRRLIGLRFRLRPRPTLATTTYVLKTRLGDHRSTHASINSLWNERPDEIGCTNKPSMTSFFSRSRCPLFCGLRHVWECWSSKANNYPSCFHLQSMSICSLFSPMSFARFFPMHDGSFQK